MPKPCIHFFSNQNMSISEESSTHGTKENGHGRLGTFLIGELVKNTQHP